MKYIFLLTILFAPIFSFSQSKKTQIIELQLKVDSLINAQNIEKDQYESSLRQMEVKFNQQNNKIKSLEDSLLKFKKEINNYKISITKNETEINNLKNKIVILRDSIQQTLFYEFDKIKPQLKKDLVPEATKIKTWLEKTINISVNSLRNENYFTPKLIEYMHDVPDDIMLGNDENLEQSKKDFHSKWSKNFDMMRITAFWHYFGNGGCIKYNLSNSVYLGQINQEFYFIVKMYCDKPKEGINFILKVIPYGNSYRIANIMSEEKSDWFDFPSF